MQKIVALAYMHGVNERIAFYTTSIKKLIGNPCIKEMTFESFLWSSMFLIYNVSL